MDVRSLRWGLVGLGSLAANGIVPAAARSQFARITAGMTRDAAKGQAFGAAHHIPRIHATVEALVEDPEVDAVFVMSPNDAHLAPVLAAAAAGKPVLCEKPLAMTEADAQRMIDACEQAGVMLRLGLHLRFEKFLDRVAEVLREGRIGTVRALSIERAAPLAERSAWREDPARGGSILYDVGLHLLDAVPRLIGQALVDVAGLASPPPGSGMGADTITLLLRSEGDVQVSLRASREAPYAGNDLVVIGTAGMLRTGPLRWAGEFSMTITNAEGVVRERMDACDLYRDELDGFARDLADGGTRLGTGSDGLRLVRMAAVIERALAEGRRLPFA
ncbi:Gfo/Idh/MocA family protein [Plastoroseomonas arctica]|uniref:Gfo/Idh/MocA family oxidoreductase n=1 Tax=Plastoroseomonas arctica TaxID=1509237 RepID=A0AAF1JUZ7_9PROT|nr:Gfo/Idh/MocA family oxidoreductase [Plastoroseomonas arctica]MBR0653687.1 Gfo/Idh/MocA family oxidoreductase [Plastoroseomonas arctica]